MSDNRFRLKESCKVSTNIGDDTFVGLKVDGGKFSVFFPQAFSITEDENQLRIDIKLLLNVLSKFKENDGADLIVRNEVPQFSTFPYLEYKFIIEDFYSRNGIYYHEIEHEIVKKNNGKIKWKNTINNINSYVQNKSIIYLEFMSRRSSSRENQIYSEIHKYFVYESFKNLGWLYGDYTPKKPTIKLNRNLFINLVSKKINLMNNDRDRLLFKKILSILLSINESNSKSTSTFGTYQFEYVWQNLINYVFGVENKDIYLPRGLWFQKYGTVKKSISSALEPDTIMLENNDIYVLDSKFYKYGIRNHKDAYYLPKSSDISKQITYGQFVNKNFGSKINNIYNAFLLPYNKLDNDFNLSDNYLYIGYATGDWITKPESFELIHTILIDLKYIMMAALKRSNKERNYLSSIILSQ